jgi:hypothetical protein
MDRLLRAVLGALPDWYRTRPNYVRLVFHPEGLRRFIVNWDEGGASTAHASPPRSGPGRPDARMRARARRGARVSDIPRRVPAPDVDATCGIVIPMHLVKDDVELRLFSTVTTVGAPRDVTVQELRIECFIPADDASEEAVAALARSSGWRKGP